MQNNSKSTGISFLGLLTIVFIVLRLTGIIAWSWVWVLAPVWIPIVIALVVLLVGLIIVKIL